MRKSRMVRPKGSTRSMRSGYRQQHRGDGVTRRDSGSVGDDRDRIGQRRGGQLMAALSTHGLHVVATVVPEPAGNSHVVSLAVGPTAQTVVSDGHQLGALQLVVSGHLAQGGTGEQLEADE